MSVKESKSTQELLARIRDLEIENMELKSRLDRWTGACDGRRLATSSVSLSSLPEDVLREIVGYLGYKDQANLSSTCRDLRLLRPREQIGGRRENFTLGTLGPAERIMDVPVLARDLTAVKMSFRWATSNPKPGFMWLHLMRNGEVVEESPVITIIKQSLFATETIEVSDHAVVTSARKGDTLVMAMTVFGHMWTIRDFTVTLYYKR